MLRRMKTILVVSLLLSLGSLSTGFCQQRADRPDRYQAGIVERWLGYTQLDFRQGVRSFRLDGMGGLTISLEDENNKVNLYDFTGNIAGLWEDRENTHVDFWMDRSGWDGKDRIQWIDWANDTTLTIERSMTDRYTRYGGSAVYRSPSGFAIGAYFEVGNNELSSDHWLHDYEELEWALDRITPDYFEDSLVRAEEWPLNDSICQSLLCSGSVCTFDSTFSVSSKYYDFGAMLNLVMGSTFSIGMKAYTKEEGESRSNEVRYAIDDTYNEPGLELGMGLKLGGVLTVAGNIEYSKIKMQGLSDGMADTVEIAHYDTFDYDRPKLGWGGQVALDGGGFLKGVVAYRHEAWDGEESYVLDWVNSEVYQSGGGGIRVRGKSLEDSYSSGVGSARWLISSRSTGTSVGLRASYGSSKYERTLVPDTLTVHPCRVRADSLNLNKNFWKFGGGFAQRIGRSVLLGAEFEASSKEEIDARTNLQLSENGAWEARGGLEYTFTERLSARAGYAIATLDPSTAVEDDTYSLKKITLGVSYLPETTVPIRLDLLYQRSSWEKDGSRAPIIDSSNNEVALYGRMLF